MKETSLNVLNKFNSKLYEHKMKQMQVTNLTLTFMHMSLFLLIQLPIISRHDSNISYLLQSILISRIRKHNLYMKRKIIIVCVCVCVCVQTHVHMHVRQMCWGWKNEVKMRPEKVTYLLCACYVLPLRAKLLQSCPTL